MFATAIRGATGVGSTMFAMYLSSLPQIEAWLRVISLLVGIAVGVATFISIIRRHRHAHPKRK